MVWRWLFVFSQIYLKVGYKRLFVFFYNLSLAQNAYECNNMLIGIASTRIIYKDWLIQTIKVSDIHADVKIIYSHFLCMQGRCHRSVILLVKHFHCTFYFCIARYWSNIRKLCTGSIFYLLDLSWIVYLYYLKLLSQYVFVYVFDTNCSMPWGLLCQDWDE